MTRIPLTVMLKNKLSSLSDISGNQVRIALNCVTNILVPRALFTIFLV